MASGPTAGNGWRTTTCNVLVVAAYPVLSCTPQTGNAGNSWLTITCPAPNVTTNVPVLTCTAAAAAAGNAWTTTTCPAAVVTTNVPVATCTAAAAIAGNSWTTTTCPAAITTGPTAAASCTAAVASAGNSWTTTSCPPNNTTNVPVLTCTASAASAGNSWTDTTCPAANVTTNVPVLACAAAAAVAGNFWTSTTCPAPVVTTNVPVATCTAAAAIAGNSWTSTTCPAPITTGPTYLAVCTPVAAAAGNSWTATICTPNNTTNVPVASCTASAASVGNNWMATTCTPNNSLSVPVSSCIAQAPAAGNGYTTVNCTPNNTTNVPVATCSNSVATGANNWVATTCTTNTTTNVPVSSCTPIAPAAGNGYMTTTCPVLTSGPTGAPSCVASGPSAGNGYTTTTCASTNTGPTPIAACTPVPATAANGWTATSCPTIVTGPTVVATCTAAVPNLGNNFTRTDCAALSGKKIQYVTTTTVDTTFFSGGLPTGSLPTVTTTGGLTDLDGVCYAPNVVPPALPVPNPQAPSWTAADATTYPSCGGWPCSESTALGGARSVNSLADVAQYYYVTDLRPATTWPPNISTDDVPAVGSGPEDDRVRWQHMTTFSIALGVSGTLTYRPDYKSGSAVTGDFAGIRVGSKNWPLWPDPALENPAACPACYANDKNLWNNPRAIDDFWHAAVNGRGTYFSAGNPTSVIAGLADALAGISARLASASGAGTSNLEPVPGDNLIYLAQYTTSKWTGDVQAKEIDLATGAVLPTVIWSAQAQLDARTNLACDTRSIYLFRQGAANNLVNFTWNTSACDVSGLPTGAPSTGLNATEQAYFGPPNSDLLSQVPSMTDGTLATADQRTPAKNANLLNFLRGQRGLEDFTSNDATRLFRKRDHVLGDTVDGQPIYVRAPFASYGDAGYGAFKLANAGRTPMLYVPANDGMLHAFYAGANKTDPLGGKEAWAIVPSTVLPNLYKLADDNYKNNHAFFVDGTPAVTDFFDSVSGTWKTILVAGLNDGGKGYYAIDITDPLAPKGLWEFKTNPAVCPANAAGVGGVVAAAAGNTSDCHLGYTFGKPITSKLADGTWVVMVSSGYNNVNAPALTGDGEGYLYVLNASTGQILYKIGTGVGTATTPSGLAQLNNYVDKPETSNLTVRLYGTDVLGNIWRFDVNDNTAPAGREATRVGTAKDAGGTAQPITTRPEISQLNGQPMLFVATGRLLGASDVGDVQVQSIYGIVDPLVGSPAFANLRSALAPLGITQVGSGAGAYRTVACTGSTLQCGSGVGWVVNLPDIGERVNVEMKFRQGTLVVGSNVPQISACTSGGYSWLNYLDFQSGLAVTGGAAGTVSEQVANSLIVGLTLIKLPDGTVKAIVTTSDANIYLGSPSFKPTGIKGGRISWREIAAP